MTEIKAQRLGSIEEYDQLHYRLDQLGEEDPQAALECVREYAKLDLYFLMRFVLSESEWRMPGYGSPWRHPYPFRFCKLVEEHPTSALFVHFRGGMKSRIVTKGVALQKIFRDHNTAILLLSAQKQYAVKHADGIRQEIEKNKWLYELFPGIYPEYDGRQLTFKTLPVWSRLEGFTVNRDSSRPEPTLFPGSLLNPPTGGHYDHLAYDDVIDEDSVTDPEKIERVKAKMSLCMNLVNHGVPWTHLWAGTFYAADDPYVYAIEQGVVDYHHIQPCVDPLGEDLHGIGGSATVFLSADQCMQALKTQGVRNYGRQMLCDAKAGETQSLDPLLVQRYQNKPEVEGKHRNIYICVDPAKGFSEQASLGKTDPTAIGVWGLGEDRTFALLDGVKDWLRPVERLKVIIDLAVKWTRITGRRIQEIRYEEVAGVGDTEFLKKEMNERCARFKVVSISTPGSASKRHGKKKKILDCLDPVLDKKLLYVPEELPYTRQDGVTVDLAEDLVVTEIGNFPVTGQDHMLDEFCLLFVDPKKYGELVWPSGKSAASAFYKRKPGRKRVNNSWMSL